MSKRPDTKKGKPGLKFPEPPCTPKPPKMPPPPRPPGPGDHIWPNPFKKLFGK